MVQPAVPTWTLCIRAHLRHALLAFRCEQTAPAATAPRFFLWSSPGKGMLRRSRPLTAQRACGISLARVQPLVLQDLNAADSAWDVGIWARKGHHPGRVYAASFIASSSMWMQSPWWHLWPSPADRSARASSGVLASTHHSSNRVTAMVA